ncbi:SMP-30/gluconolactonase/LRE family protein [Sphingobium xenophagum]|uniref:SMP-30/gluconolactonase/LRE family protein n=1 Tax=Sphingobium xenophagum TaxID=121428 RepID=UPI000399AF7C|nr:SMP-30/gluconolactonase/LRE family protein [Sphingobium xenophagum]
MKLTSDLLAKGFIFPETPRWHAGRQAFYFVDIDDGKLFELKGGEVRMLSKQRDMISGMAFDDADGFFVASVFDRKILHLKNWLSGTREVTEIADCSTIAENMINDMVRSPRGDFYVDTINYDAFASFEGKAEKKRSPLLRVTTEGEVGSASDATFFANGSVIFPGEDRLLTADTYDACVYAFSINGDGSLGPATIFADLPGEMPDGMCGDVRGGLWVATRNRVIRVIEGGEITDEVNTGDHIASACALGGADGRTLLITASEGHDRRHLWSATTGVLLTAEVEIPGAGLPSLYD